MKIIYLHQYFNKPNMSGGTRSYEFAKRLAQNGHEVRVITASIDGTVAFLKTKSETFEGFKITWIGVPYNNKMNAARRVLSFVTFMFAAAVVLLRSSRADVIYSTSTPLSIAIPSLLYSKVKDVPHIFEVRDLWPDIPIALGVIRHKFLKDILWRFEEYIYKNSRLVVALSPGMAQAIRNKVASAQVVIIPNSSDILDFGANSNSALPPKFQHLKDENYLLYAGQIGPINDIERFLNCIKCSLNQNKNIKYVFVGHGKSFKQVYTLAQELGILNNGFYLYDKISKIEVRTLFKNATASLGLFKDLKEMQTNSSNKFFDSLASGKPMIINYGGWMKNLLEAKSCGISVAELSAPSSARKIIEFVTDKDQLKTCSENSYKLAENHFSRDRHFKLLQQTIYAAYSTNDTDIDKIIKDSEKLCLYNLHEKEL